MYFREKLLLLKEILEFLKKIQELPKIKKEFLFYFGTPFLFLGTLKFLSGVPFLFSGVPFLFSGALLTHFRVPEKFSGTLFYYFRRLLNYFRGHPAGFGSALNYGGSHKRNLRSKIFSCNIIKIGIESLQISKT